MKGFIAGITAYANVFYAVSRYRLWGYMFVPGLIGLLLGGGIYWSAQTFADDIGELFASFYPDTWWGSEIVGQISELLGGALVVVTGLLIFKYLLLIVVSPFMSLLSERMERKSSLSAVMEPLTFARFFSEFLRSLRLNLRNIIREVLLILLLWLLSFSGVLAPVTTVLIFLVGAYYAGFGVMDYTMERHLSYRDSIHFVRNNRGLALGLGTGFMLILLIPVAGFFLAPTFATIAGTQRVLERL